MLRCASRAITTDVCLAGASHTRQRSAALMPSDLTRLVLSRAASILQRGQYRDRESQGEDECCVLPRTLIFLCLHRSQALIVLRARGLQIIFGPWRRGRCWRADCLRGLLLRSLNRALSAMAFRSWTGQEASRTTPRDDLKGAGAKRATSTVISKGGSGGRAGFVE